MTRKEAIEYLRKADCTVYREPKTKTAEALEMAIQELQEQKVGKWIEEGYVGDWIEGNDNYEYVCSECGHTDIHSKAVKVNYCWCCGSKMEGVEDVRKSDRDV